MAGESRTGQPRVGAARREAPGSQGGGGQGFSPAATGQAPRGGGGAPVHPRAPHWLALGEEPLRDSLVGRGWGWDGCLRAGCAGLGGGVGAGLADPCGLRPRVANAPRVGRGRSRQLGTETACRWVSITPELLETGKVSGLTLYNPCHNKCFFFSIVEPSRYSV